MMEFQFCGNEAEAVAAMECAECTRALDDWAISSMTTRAEFIRTAVAMLCHSHRDADAFAKRFACDFRLGAAISVRGIRAGELVALLDGAPGLSPEMRAYVLQWELQEWKDRNGR